jgi:Cu(I)/Ag(I) efflux system membrane fusion protein
VVSSQFLIDSEASLRGTILRLTPDMGSMDMETPTEEPVMDMPETAVEAQAVGTVISLMREHGMVTLEHGPIEALNWPSMTMPFVTKPEYLQGLKKGDHVSITVLAAPDENGSYVLSNIKKVDMEPENMGAEQ